MSTREIQQPLAGKQLDLSPLPAALDPAPTEAWLAAARKARLLSWISLAWMGAEGLIAVTAGVIAGSIALIGFGIDSFIEGIASLVIVWRFTGSRLHSVAAETRAQKLVAAQVIAAVALKEGRASWRGEGCGCATC